ncbi:MAG TPA: BlaI/MecI/CopY family transcriptional regulator [Sedimentisphaerales bacterium]|jgi:BlaI family penicillinase repressor|nr:BlaI/MecI/CopY family transcriptional regulator [Sedimentisphaerales bacterium]HNU30388.1 BlaI/MecI/CopY family transcriptional regulator [Sedimentisphaerales bacterium]
MGTSKQQKAGRRKKTTTELTEAEWEIMKVVWEKEPCAAGTVQEALAATRDWCYATVKLTMDRMVEKGFLEIEKIRNLQLFRSCISEVEARRGELRRMLARAFNGALTPLVQFLIEHEGLSKEEAAALRRLVRKTVSKGD